MTSKISMTEIPFAPLDYAPRLADTVPPTKPPAAPLPVKRPASHMLVAWREDGRGLQTWKYETLETAQAAAKELCWIIYYKYAIQCGRDMIERGDIVAPDDYADAFVRWQNAQKTL